MRADAPEDGPADLDFLPHPAHVWTGQLAPARIVLEHRNPRPSVYSRWRTGIFTFRSEIKMIMALLVVLAAILPYAATGSSRVLLVFGVPFGLMAVWLLKHIWRRARAG